MLRTRFIFLICVTCILAGCQQAYQNVSIPSASTAGHASMQMADSAGTAKDTSLAAINREDEQTGTSSLKFSDDSRSVQKNQTDSDAGQLNDNQISSDEDSQQNHESEICAQDKIDQALELCNYAQQMWEKGKIDDALSNLDSAYSAILDIDSDASPEFHQQKEDIRYLISKRILEIYASRQIVVAGLHNEIPLTLNKYVQNEIKRLTGPDRKFFIQSLERAQRYRPFIMAELKKAGLPQDISWLPLIESGFKIRALSPARALGLWQFIPSTGYKFGLSRNYYIDERLDPEKSTRAAISYLKELHNLFGDWTTALAAYNCGEARVLRIIRRQKINYLDNFWDLYQNLPAETARYVPKFLATLYIVKHPDKYNIKIKHTMKPIRFRLCNIKKQVRLKDIAREIGVDTRILKELNPELRYALLPPDTYPLKIPEDKADLFLSKIDKIKSTYSPPPMYVFHRVRRGQTLSGIARKYRTSVRAISIVNHISKNHRIIAGKVLKIPAGRRYAFKSSNGFKTSGNAGRRTYTVRRGDSLWNIACKFGTTTKNIMAINRLSSTKLKIGQTLYICDANSYSGDSSDRGTGETSTYRVRSGDSPFLIAKKYNMSLHRFLALNHLNKRSKIFPGQKLIVE